MSSHASVLALGILLASCDADEQPAAPSIPTVQPEPAKAAAPERGLGAEVAGEVAKAKTRCADAGGIDRATDLDGDVTGAWTGEYRYDDPGRDPVVMDASFTAVSGVLTGSTTEPNTFAPGAPPELPATVAGEVLVGGRITFMKAYDAGTVQHSILYIGQLDARRRTLAGRWRTRGASGTFELQRAGLRG
jgi:hypothetical protein